MEPAQVEPTPAEPTPRHADLGVDYLGFLNGELRDLKGFATLAHELIQNADDADGASEITFDVTDEALLVHNDGPFSSCGDPGGPRCAWVDRGVGHLCDFHRFRRTASGDKRRQPGTTGAFGIGFISVYQITDRPELTSGSSRWVIRPEEPQERRVFIYEQDPPEPGTRFRLPWARDPGSTLRRELALEAVTEGDVEALLRVTEDALPSAALFLKRLGRLRLLKNGAPVRGVEREPAGDRVTLRVDDEPPVEWLLLRGSFEAEAAALRERAGPRIEEGREATVTVAVPLNGTAEGRFHACLPTRHPLRLPFHVNADFFPSSDRKRIVFEGDYQGDWNRAAVAAAADTVARGLPALRDALGEERLWGLLHAAWTLRDDGGEDAPLRAFWERVGPAARALPLVPTLVGWRAPAEALLLLSPSEEAPVLPILEALGLPVAPPALAPYSNLLRTLGVAPLDALRLAAALRQAGLDKRTPAADAPGWLLDDAQRGLLSEEVAVLLRRPSGSTAGPAAGPATGSTSAQAALAACALALAEDGAFAPPADLVRATAPVAGAMRALGLRAFLPAADNPSAIAGLVPEATPKAIVRLLKGVAQSDLDALWTSRPDALFDLLEWLLSREDALRSDPPLRADLAALRVWPSATALHPLTALVVPGSFEDPLGLSDVVHPRLLTDRLRPALVDTMGARELTFAAYAADLVPQAFEQGRVDERARTALVAVFNEHLFQLQGNKRARTALEGCPLVLCSDGAWRKPSETYADTPLVRAILGRLPFARVGPATRDLLDWLGVASRPRPQDVLARVRDITSGPPTGDRRSAARDLLEGLGTKWPPPLPEEFKALSRLAWLPVRGDEAAWHRPSELYASFQESLFASQARFLDAPPGLQNTAADFLRFIGVQEKPTVEQVCDHVRHLVDHGLPIKGNVYQFLNQAAGGAGGRAAIERKLKEAPCLYAGGRHVRPDHAFWSAHPFGQHRARLATRWGEYAVLLRALGVRDEPGPADALAVLADVAAIYAPTNSPVAEADRDVVHACWTLLADALSQGAVAPGSLAALATEKRIPNAAGLLLPPGRLFFDDAAGMAGRFGNLLDGHVIPRQANVWPAWAAAGVRSLREAAVPEIVDLDDPEPSALVLDRIVRRRPLLARALEWSRPGASAALGVLDGLEVQETAALRVRYRLAAFGGTYHSEPESAGALTLPDRSLLLVASPGGLVNWNAVARELAAVLNPEDEARVVLALKGVLAPGADADAARDLDDLGCPLLEESAVVTAEGGVLDVEEPEEAPTAEPLSEPQAGTAPTPPGPTTAAQPAAPTAPPLTPASQEPASRGAAPQGPAPPRETPPKATVTQPGPPHGTPPPASPTHKPPPEPPRRRPHPDAPPKGSQPYRLVSYVQRGDPNDETAGAGSEQSEATKARRALGDAGEDAVVAFERTNGRPAERMPTNNPGYDVESVEPGGRTRFIEVKTIPDDWGARGVALSDTQFRCAQEKGADYWLYVVERYGTPEARLTCIRDPAGIASHFAFDDGWRDAGDAHPLTSPPTVPSSPPETE